MSRSVTPTPRRHQTWTQSFADRSTLANTSLLAAYLFHLMATKRTNLCLSADVQSTAQLLEIAEECGDSICVLKTHCDIIDDFGDRTIRGLLSISTKKRFLIFEDRKFGDIGNTVQMQYAAGTHRIASWATLTNAHVFPGPAVITALKEAAQFALTASNNQSATEIYGGSGPRERGSYFPPAGVLSGNNTQLSDDEDEDDEGEEERRESINGRQEKEEEEEEEEEDVSHNAPPAQASPLSTADRKSSIVSISTTISSSTEYVSPSARTTPNTIPASSLDKAPVTRGLLLLAQMSSADNLFTNTYTQKCVEMARSHRDFVMGFIAQESLNSAPGDNFVVMTPGVNLPAADDDTRASSERPWSGSGLEQLSQSGRDDRLGQQYNTPRSVILEKGVDIIIVGRGILQADDREAEAERYRWAGWKALEERWDRRR